MKKRELINSLREANPVEAAHTEEWMRGERSKNVFQRIVVSGSVAGDKTMRRRAPRLAPLGLAVLLLASVAAVYVTTRQTTDPLSVGCYESLSLEGNTAIAGLAAPSDELSAAARCASLWQSAFGAAVPSNLVTCVVPEGGLGVFPSSEVSDPGTVCSSIGASEPTDGSYAGASADQVRQWAADVETAFEKAEGTSGCVGKDRLRSILTDSFRRPGFSEWTVSSSDSASKQTCAGYSIDAMAGGVIIVMDH